MSIVKNVKEVVLSLRLSNLYKGLPREEKKSLVKRHLEKMFGNSEQPLHKAA